MIRQTLSSENAKKYFGHFILNFTSTIDESTDLLQFIGQNMLENEEVEGGIKSYIAKLAFEVYALQKYAAESLQFVMKLANKYYELNQDVINSSIESASGLEYNCNGKPCYDTNNINGLKTTMGLYLNSSLVRNVYEDELVNSGFSIFTTTINNGETLNGKLKIILGEDAQRSDRKHIESKILSEIGENYQADASASVYGILTVNGKIFDNEKLLEISAKTGLTIEDIVNFNKNNGFYQDGVLQISEGNSLLIPAFKSTNDAVKDFSGFGNNVQNEHNLEQEIIKENQVVIEAETPIIEIESDIPYTDPGAVE